MTVSGLGSARPTRSPITPPSRPPRADRSEKDKRDDFTLTAADRELIYQATGQKAEPGTTGFAAALVAERAAGRARPERGEAD